jgi:hypothetical protein
MAQAFNSPEKSPRQTTHRRPLSAIFRYLASRRHVPDTPSRRRLCCAAIRRKMQKAAIFLAQSIADSPQFG